MQLNGIYWYKGVLNNMFLGRNRFFGAGAPVEDGAPDAGGNTEFLNEGREMPSGMQRFLAKKGIKSSSDLANRIQYAPRAPFRRER